MNNVSDEEMQEHYDQFFEDVFVECEDKVKPATSSVSYFTHYSFKPLQILTYNHYLSLKCDAITTNFKFLFIISMGKLRK